jgi:hypothetical protein
VKARGARLPLLSQREVEDAAQWQRYQTDERPGLAVQTTSFFGARDVRTGLELKVIGYFATKA